MPDTYATGLRCLRCGTPYPLRDSLDGCTRCTGSLAAGLEVTYDPALTAPCPCTPQGRGLWRYGPMLPVAAQQAVTLGEGGTPLLALDRTAEALGLATLLLKDETRNPTGSFKDRLACVGVSYARASGRSVIVSSSSGNAGASAAAYAARAGMPCVIFTTPDAPRNMMTQMRALGGIVLVTAHADDRLALLRQGVTRMGWFAISPFCMPVTGSNPIAIEGYKSIAYEIAEDMGWDIPEWVVLPVCYGDALSMIWRGFKEMLEMGWTRRLPRMVAAESSGSLCHAMETGAQYTTATRQNRRSIATSIGTDRGTFQSLHTLRQSHGIAVKVEDSSMLQWQDRISQTEGSWLEISSAAAFSAVENLVRAGTISAHDRVVVLGTASGMKTPSPPPIAMLDSAILDDALDTARDVYGVDLASLHTGHGA